MIVRPIPEWGETTIRYAFFAVRSVTKKIASLEDPGNKAM